MEINTHRRVPITERSQVFLARQQVREAARDAGFSEQDDARAQLIATELATNLVKHTTAGGEILVRPIAGTPRQIEIIAVDSGPGIANLSRAFEDGVSSGSSPGTGLGAIRRLSDVFDIHSSAVGTVILSRVTAERATPGGGRFEIAGVSIPVNGERLCGDLWHAVTAADSLTVIVADGLGHGPFAHEAALSVLEETNLGTLPGSAIELAHKAVRHTRGAAAAMAQVASGQRAVRYAGIGNISGLIRTDGRQQQMVSINGTLGHQVHAIRQFTYDWTPSSLLVMFSDGLSSHWDLAKYAGLERRHPAVIAAVLYRDSSRRRDDVTVVVAREVA